MTELILYAQLHWIEWLFGGVSVVLGILYRNISKRLKEEQTKNKAIGDGMQAILRDRIIQSYNYYQDKEYCPIYAKENVNRMYKAYHALDGNDVATKLKDSLMAMPEEPEEKEK